MCTHDAKACVRLARCTESSKCSCEAFVEAHRPIPHYLCTITIDLFQRRTGEPDPCRAETKSA